MAALRQMLRPAPSAGHGHVHAHRHRPLHPAPLPALPPTRDAGSSIQQQDDGPSFLQQALGSGQKQSVAWGEFLGTLFAAGSVTGTLLDGIHSRTALQVYDLAAFQLGPLYSSWLVPPLLGTWYCVMGLLICAGDNLANSSSSKQGSSMQEGIKGTEAEDNAPRFAGGGLAGVALAYGLLAANLQLSATLFERGVSPTIIGPCLAATAVLSWWFMDGTRRGAVLATVCGVGAPVVEVVLMNTLHTWHYTQPDLGGVFMSWVPWCYAGYVPVLAVLSRYLWRTSKA